MNRCRTSDSRDLVERGVPIVISGPAGVGKTVVTRTLLKRYDDVVYAISATSRDIRPGEADGRDYFFLTPEEFKRKIEAGEFIEYTERLGKFYGTLKQPLLEKLDAGHDVVMDLDFRGAEAMRREFPKGLFIYLLSPSQEMLAERLRSRKRDPEKEIEQRLKLDLAEARHMLDYDYLTVNWEVEETAANVHTIIVADRFRKRRCIRMLIRLGCVPPELEQFL